MGKGAYLSTLVFMLLIIYIFKLKSEFLAVQRLRGMSGWSWDEARHRVTAPDDVWDAHIAVCDLIFSHGVEMTDLAVGSPRR